MKRKIKSQSLIFIVATFICSYVFWGILCFSARGIIYKNIFYSMYTELYVLGGFAPSVVGIVLIMYFDGIKGIKPVLEKLKLKNVKVRYVLFALLFTISTVLIPKLICDIFGISVDVSLKEEFRGAGKIIKNISYFIAVLFIEGGVNEEFGWRGFLLPRLQRKVHPIAASLIIGIIWSVWHVPLFMIAPSNYIIGYLSIGLSFAIYTIETIWLACIFTWIFNKTNGCLLIVILFHAVDNTVLSMINIDNSVISPYLIIMNALRILIFIYVIIDMCKHESEKVKNI